MTIFNILVIIGISLISGVAAYYIMWNLFSIYAVIKNKDEVKRLYFSYLDKTEGFVDIDTIMVISGYVTMKEMSDLKRKIKKILIVLHK